MVVLIFFALIAVACASPGPGPSPSPPTPVQWTGVNIVGFDYGNLARASGTWCTDETCSVGGWSDPRYHEDNNCPGYGGNNKTATYTPAKLCNSQTGIPTTYNGGFGAPKDFKAVNFGDPTVAIKSGIPVYARASPLIDEVKGAVSAGANVFRVPFRIEYVYELWNGTWLVNDTIPDYLRPSPLYLQMVMDFIEATLQEQSVAGNPVNVIFDMHNYMRWCPMGIGGEYGCLEPGRSTGQIVYSKDPNSSNCPFSDVFKKVDFPEACPKKATPAQLERYWDSPILDEGFTGAPDLGMEDSVWKCPLDLIDVPMKSRWETCGDNRNSKPQPGLENPYAKIITGSCFQRIWEKLLKVPVSSVAFPGQCVELYKVLDHYSDESKPSISISLMNEPNMVNTATLAKTYKDTVTSLRGPQFNLRNRILMGGNYWSGLHAQIDPTDRSAAQTCGAPAASSQGYTDKSKGTPIEQIYNAIKDVPNLGLWTYDAHQYFDYESTGNYDCVHSWINDTCGAGTEQQVSEFINWEPFIQFIKKNDISVAITEFAMHPSARCSAWLTTFLGLLEKNKYVKNQGGVIMWTAWRTCPHVSWNQGDAALDCIQWAAPQQNIDPPQYEALWRATSIPGLTNGVKDVLSKFFQGRKTAPTASPNNIFI